MGNAFYSGYYNVDGYAERRVHYLHHVAHIQGKTNTELANFAPSLVFLHQHGLSKAEFADAITDLQEYNVVAIDAPCHGHSSCWEDPADTDADSETGGAARYGRVLNHVLNL